MINYDHSFISAGPVVLCIMDGWGHRTEKDNNAVALADTPNVDKLAADWPTSLLAASGNDVGLPDGQVGNSEVGHMNIGAGRVVTQDLPKINAALRDGSLTNHPDLIRIGQSFSRTDRQIHVMGLLSPGGVHSHQDHMLAVINGLVNSSSQVIIHGFTDGRDVMPKSAARTLSAFNSQLPDGARFGTLMGRYFAMDRDQRWDRTEAAFNAITHARCNHNASASTKDALSVAYAAGESDEFITPRVMVGYGGMQEGDAIVMINFRGDRVRQILNCWLSPQDVGFDVQSPVLSKVIGMTSYSERLDPHMTTLYEPQKLQDTLGDVVARANRSQLRLAETEKYPHVTFFLNGGVEATQHKEDRMLVPSPKVKTYDQQPEMSAAEILAVAMDSITAKTHDLIIMNFANPDMVGHTGSLQAAMEAVSCVDGCVGKLADAVLRANGQMLLTADHGNCEVMLDEETGSPHTAHTTNLVPCTHIGAPVSSYIVDGRLADIAPSLLLMLDIAQPDAMTGTALQRIKAI